MGTDGEWVKYAEDKLKRDAQLNYQELVRFVLLYYIILVGL